MSIFHAGCTRFKWLQQTCDLQLMVFSKERFTMIYNVYTSLAPERIFLDSLISGSFAKLVLHLQTWIVRDGCLRVLGCSSGNS